MFFINSVLKSKNKDCDEDFFVNVIMLLLYALSRNSFAQDIRDRVASSLEHFLYEISRQIFKNKEFSVSNIKPMQEEIQVYYV